MRSRLARVLLSLGTALTPVWVAAQDLPTGSTILHGDVTVTQPGANALAITQGSNRAVLNWDSFSIGADSRVDITQPDANSALLNRVTGDTTSQIHGQLNANGQVYLVNPNGIFIGPNGTVNAGGFVASTLGMRTEDFVLGAPVFEGNGSSATVTNQGTIEVVTGGYAALIGGKVRNDGIIRAPMGRVGLASGELVTLDLSGDGFLQVAIPTDSDDDGLDALIENAGTIEANGGQVHIKAATARNAARHAINLSGVVEARTVSGRNGAITLGGGNGGRVTVSGRARVSAPRIQVTQSARPQVRPTGGSITITGNEIALDGAMLDASGPGGGGNIRIGGNERGAAGLQTASTLNVDSGSVILADALVNGDGGRVILWSDVHTDFAGAISARGGAEGGNGGFAEVSGKLNLSFDGTADLRAEQGDWGKLLLDPTDVFIVDILTGATGEILASTLETQLGVSDVEIITVDTDSNGNDLGDITVNAGLTWTTEAELILDADHTIIINQPITALDGVLTLSAGGATPISTGADGDINVGIFFLENGDFEQISSSLPAFEATNFFMDPGTGFLRALGGDGSSDDPFQITDVYGLQGIGSAGNLTSNYVLANDIDADGVQNWTDPDGYNPGFSPILTFEGTLDGARHTISSLNIFQSTLFGDGRAGMFDTIAATGVVRNLSFESAFVGGGHAGVLAHTNLGTIDAVSTGGDVFSFGGRAGGLVAENAGAITNSFSTVVVVDGFDSPIESEIEPRFGGLVGVNDFAGTITNSHSGGSVRLILPADGSGGGLVGDNFGQITDSYSLADVTVDDVSGEDTGEVRIGGLVGANAGTITRTFATGLVEVESTCCLSVDQGGLVGINEIPEVAGTVVGSFWDTDATGQTSSDGGGTGLSTAQMTDTEGFIALAEPLGWDFFDTWAPPAGSNYARNYTTSPVIFLNPLATEFVYQGDDFVPEFTLEFGGLTFVEEAPVGNAVPDFLFGPSADTINTVTVTNTAEVEEFDVGAQTFGFAATTLPSTQGVDYDVVSTTALANITPAPLDIVVDSTTKVYGEEVIFAGDEFVATGLLGLDTIESADVLSDGAAATAQVADSPFDITVDNLEGDGLDNYTITVTDGTLEVTPAPLSITVDDQSKVYGETFTFAGDEFLTAGLVNNDSVDSLSIDSLGAAATALVADSPFVISGSTPIGTGLGNYTITITAGSMIVTPAPLTITADDQAKGFGDAFTFDGDEFTVVGLANDDTVASATLNSTAAAADAPVTDESAAAIIITDPLGTGLENYTITLVNGLFVVAPATLTITANDQTKVYGTEFTFDGTEFVVAGLLDGDSVDSVTLASDGAAATATVAGSPFAITASDPSGTGLDNYAITFALGSFTVTPASLDIAVADQTKVYGTEFTFAGTEFVASGLLNADSIDSLTLSSAGAAIAAQVADSPFEISGADAVGVGVGNYTLNITPGSMTVTPAPLTITAEDQNKIYGTEFAFDGTEFIAEGLITANEDSVDTVELASAAAAVAATVTGEGSEAITIVNPLGSGLDNYEITLQEGAFGVDAADLVITANNQSKVYGTEFSFAGDEFTTEGLITANGDSVESADLSSIAAAVAAQATGEGTEVINIANAAGTGLDNYNIDLREGSFAVDRAPLTITADNQNKFEGDELIFDGTEFSTDGLVVANGDSVDSAFLASEGAGAEARTEDSPFDIDITGPEGSGLENYDIALVRGILSINNDVPPPPVNPIPPFVVTLPNPTDTVDIGGDDGGTGGIQTAGNGGTSTQTLQEAQEVLAIVDQSSTELELAVQSCGSPDQDFTNFMSCLSASLDTYANALDQIANDLPQGSETVSAIIREARTGVQAATARAQTRLAGATTDAQRSAIRRDAVNEARASIDTAKSEIRKAISLIRAEDPAVEQVQKQTVSRIVQAFDTVDTQLVRAVEL